MSSAQAITRLDDDQDKATLFGRVTPDELTRSFLFLLLLLFLTFDFLQ